MAELNYSWQEQMAVVLARELRDEDVIAVGGAVHQIPFAAVMLARELYVPSITIQLTSGLINPVLSSLPSKAGDYRFLITEAESQFIFHDAFTMSENGPLDVFFL